MIDFISEIEFIEFIGDTSSPGGGGADDGELDFSDTENSGLIVALFEDI